MNFQYSDLLLTIAELSGVLIGFANLASALEKSQDVVVHQFNKLRLIMITESGIATIFGCLLPFLVATFSNDELIILKMSSIFFSPVIVLIILFFLLRIKKMMGTMTPTRITPILFAMAILFVLTPSILIITNLVRNNLMAGVYCLGIVTLFMILCIVLVRLLRSIIL
jgi:hypothetical protein